MAHPNDETLSFTALMIKFTNVNYINYSYSSNINTLDISNLYHYKSSTTYKTSATIYIHSFRKKFIDPLHLRLFKSILYFDELLRFL